MNVVGRCQRNRVHSIQNETQSSLSSSQSLYCTASRRGLPSPRTTPMQHPECSSKHRRVDEANIGCHLQREKHEKGQLGREQPEWVTQWARTEDVQIVHVVTRSLVVV